MACWRLSFSYIFGNKMRYITSEFILNGLYSYMLSIKSQALSYINVRCSMMKLVVMKGKYFMCGKIYFLKNNIRYTISGKANLTLNYGLYDGENIHFLPSTEGTLTFNDKHVNGVAIFATDSNNAIVAYGSTPNVNKKRFDECYRKNSAMLKSKKDNNKSQFTLIQNDETNLEVESNNKVVTNIDTTEKLYNNAETINDTLVVEEVNNEINEVIIEEAIDIGDSKENIADYLEKNCGQFYEDIKGQLDELFEKYPRNTELEMRVMDSKWVNINYDAKSYYTVGVISEGDIATVICYGVPYEIKSTPPSEIEDYCQWLPLDKTDVNKAGYYVMYQNAINGEIIK